MVRADPGRVGDPAWQQNTAPFVIRLADEARSMRNRPPPSAEAEPLAQRISALAEQLADDATAYETAVRDQDHVRVSDSVEHLRDTAESVRDLSRTLFALAQTYGVYD